jgi:hypothetical protein
LSTTNNPYLKWFTKIFLLKANHGILFLIDEVNVNQKIMSRNNIILAAIGGAIVAVVVANYLGTEKGKQTLSAATDLLKDLAGKATELAKTSIGNLQPVEDHA